MDPPLPGDFDPHDLIDDPMQQPSKRDDERQQGSGSQKNRADDLEETMHFLPASMKRFVVAGSCCTGVAALYFLTSWDHGWIPGLESPLAQASDLRDSNLEIASMKGDLKELYILSIARAIRDLQAEMCSGRTRAQEERLEELQYKYEDRTGSRYPPTDCPGPASGRRY